MKKYTVRFRLVGQAAFTKVVYEAPDMEIAVKCGYDFAKGMHGIAIADFQVVAKDNAE